MLVAPERSGGGIVFARFGGHAGRLDKSDGGKKIFQDEFPTSDFVSIPRIPWFSGIAGTSKESMAGAKISIKAFACGLVK
jgi:hypothetical protein